MSSTPTPPAMPMPSDAPTSSPSPSLPRQPCRYLTSPGGCRYGDACRFIHPSDAIVQQQQQSQQQQQQQQQLQPPHPSHMQSQMQPHMPIPMQPSHIHIPLQQQSSQDPSSQSSPPPVQMAYPPGYPFYSPNEMNFEEGQTPYMYPPPSHTQTHININMPPSPYQTPTPTHFPSPSLTPSPYQGPHLPPPYQASPSLQPFPTTANPTYPQPPPQQLTPYQMYAYQYQQQQLIPYMQNAAHAYAAAGYTPQQQQQMLHQLAMSLQMMPPMVNPPMETRTMHLTRRDKNNINAQGMCKYYVAGKCNYGGTCRFPHDVMSAMAYQQANYGLTNGSPHPRTPQPQPQSDVDTLTETMDNVHLQSPPSSSRQRRNKSGSSSPSQQVCRYYHQGTCRFGDQCKFQHIEMTTPSTSTSSTSTSTSTPATYNDSDKLGTSNMDRQHVWKSLQITEKSSDIIDTTSSIPSSHTLIIYHSRFSSTHTFMDLVQHEHDACITFLHDLIEFLENVHGIMDYSIRIEQTVATEEEREECKEGDSSINPTGSFRVRVLYGGDLLNANTRTTPASDQLSKTLIHTTPHNRIWFDYHGRPALIITPQSHVERPSQLDDTQLYALLCDPITQLRREYEHVLAKSRRDEEEGEHELKEMITPRRLPPMTFQHLIINVGGYRRIRDLHIKMTLDPSLFTLITSTWPAALQQRWNAAQQSSNTSTETATTANNAGKKKPIKSASANKENRKSITNGTAPTTSGKGKPATILPQQQQQQTNGTRGWASIVNKTTSTTPATTIAPSILPTSSYTNTSSSESSTSSSPNASPVTAIRR